MKSTLAALLVAFANQPSLASETFSLASTSCYLLATPEGSKEVLPKSAALESVTCIETEKEVTCIFSGLDKDKKYSVKFKVDASVNTSRLVLYAPVDNIWVLVDKKKGEYRYAEAYFIAKSPFLITKSCFGKYLPRSKQK